MMPVGRPTAVLSLALLTAGTAIAGDGVIEINEVRANAGGVTSGDSAGYPVTLSAPGSYRLSGNLALPGSATRAIEVNADNVSIDLNGFAIIGTCTAPASSTPTCPAGSGTAVHAIDAEARRNVRVHNGTVTLFRGNGVALGTDSEASDLRVNGNNGHGIIAGNGSVLRDNVVTRNRLYGAVVTRGTVMRGNVLYPNGIEADGVAVPTLGAGQFGWVAQRTALLFPYVTNAAGFDTGIAISNTGVDGTGAPGATAARSGTCTLTYHGAFLSGASTPAPATTPSIAPGRQFAMTLTGGGTGVPGITPGFSGYIVARCDFALAHGTAFVSDLGAREIGFSTPALVLDSGRLEAGPEALAQ